MSGRQISMGHKGLRVAISVLTLGVSMSADAGLFGSGGTNWKEEVLLHNGQKIIVDRSQTYGGRHEVGQSAPVKEHVISFKAPGSSKIITWSLLVFGEGVAKDAITLRPGSLMLDLGEGDAIHIENFDPTDPLANQSFASFQFADGTSLSWEGLLARGFDIDGTEGDVNPLTGTGIDDRIDGKSGNDKIHGLNGNDTLTGGTGTDALRHRARLDAICMAPTTRWSMPQAMAVTRSRPPAVSVERSCACRA